MINLSLFYSESSVFKFVKFLNLNDVNLLVGTYNSTWYLFDEMIILLFTYFSQVYSTCQTVLFYSINELLYSVTSFSFLGWSCRKNYNLLKLIFIYSIYIQQ